MSEENSHETTEAEKTGKLFENAFRFPKTGVIEKLVIQHLLQATFTKEPDVMIYHTCVAVGIVEKQENKDLAKLDFPLFRRIAALNNAFSNARKLSNNYGENMYQISWGIPATEKNYKEFIEPWIIAASFYSKYIKLNLQSAIRLIHFPKSSSVIGSSRNECGYCIFILTDSYDKELEKVLPKNASLEQNLDYIFKINNIPRTCPRCKNEITMDSMISEDTVTVDYSVPWSLFFECSSYLLGTGFDSLKNAFQKWATEPCQHAITYLCSIVSPHTYDEVYKLISGQLRTQKPLRESDNF